MTEKYQKNYTIESQKVLHFTFETFEGMKKYGKNWSFYDFFRYGTRPFKGQYDICQHPNFQIADTIYEDGLMYKGYAPKDTITLAVIIKKKGSLISNKKLLNRHEVLVMDDVKEYETIFSHYVEIGTISMQKTFVNTHFPYLNQKINKVYFDTDGLLTKMIHDVENNILCNERSIESRLLKNIKYLSLDKQAEISKKLSKKTFTVFTIRNYLIEHIEESITVNDIASHFGISDKTLQTSFKKIFGHTPKKFIKLLKLNLAYRDIIMNLGKKGSIAQIATKYGFTNFGLFSKEYKQMFGVLPSEMGGGNATLNDGSTG